MPDADHDEWMQGMRGLENIRPINKCKVYECGWI